MTETNGTVTRCPDCKARLIPADSAETWVAWCPICSAVEPMGPNPVPIEELASSRPRIRTQTCHCGDVSDEHDPEGRGPCTIDGCDCLGFDLDPDAGAE